MTRIVVKLSFLSILLLLLVPLMRTPAKADSANQLLASESFSEIRTDLRNKEPLWNNHYFTREDVEVIIFHDEMMTLPKDAWDVSADRNESVMAWMSEQTLHICADGSIYLNPNSSWLFSGFINLKSIDFGNSVNTSDVTDMSHMFSECTQLEELNLSGFNMSQVENISCMFYHCEALQNINFFGWDTSHVRLMDRLFAHCSSLKAVDTRWLNTSLVTNLSNLFYCCKSLKSLDVSSFDTRRNLYLNGMFYGCESLQTVNVSGFDTSHVIGMNYVFADCPNLITPDVSHFDVSKVQSCIDFMDPGREINGRPWEEFFHLQPSFG